MNLNNINLVKVKLEGKVKLKGLMSLYLHDLSEFAEDLKIHENGFFEYEGIDLYFEDEELMPFFVCSENEVVGFVLVNSGKFVDPNIDYSIHELFILKGFRRKRKNRWILVLNTDIQQLINESIFLEDKLVKKFTKFCPFLCILIW